MAAKLYHIQVIKDSGLIVQARDDAIDPAFVPPNQKLHRATFSSDPADNPDVVTEAGRPAQGGFYIDGRYSAPIHAYLKVSWSGDGRANGRQYEMEPNNRRSAVFAVQKWDRLTDTAVRSGGESYWVMVVGAPVLPDVGFIVLDDDGRAEVAFRGPPADVVGLADISLAPTQSGYPVLPNDQPTRLALRATRGR